MQLSEEARAARPHAGLRLNSFARTLLTLCVCTVPVLAGVLPEEEADVMWHNYNGGDITVQGPSVLIRKNVGDSLSFTVNYYEDMISSASIDVKLSASPYHETRRQWSGSVEYLHGKDTYSAGVITSKEPDYKANTIYFSVAQDMFGDLTTLTLGYRRGWDQIFRDIKTATGQIINDPTFSARADHRGYSLSLSQILTRNTIMSFNYELLTDQGYLANPYRKIRYLSPGQGEGYTLADQVYPDTRTSNAASITVKHYLPWRAAITRPIPLLPRHLGHRREYAGGGLHAAVAQLDLRRHAALLQTERGGLLQRPVSARRLPELHGARPRAGGLYDLHGRRECVLSVQRARRAVGEPQHGELPVRAFPRRLQRLS